jgi:hypothetical protein
MISRLKTTQRIKRREKREPKSNDSTKYKMYKITACLTTSISD